MLKKHFYIREETYFAYVEEMYFAYVEELNRIVS